MNKTSKPIIAGILNIIGGIVSIAEGIFLVLMIFAVQSDRLLGGFFVQIYPPEIAVLVRYVYMIYSFLTLLALIVQFAGGIYAIKRQKWLLVIISSAVTFMIVFPVGIPAVILAVLSRNEFE